MLVIAQLTTSLMISPMSYPPQTIESVLIRAVAFFADRKKGRVGAAAYNNALHDRCPEGH